jgi:UDP-3-O-[3-hydroxymyristoyl] N-acetylglucosamine deacetylase
MIKQQTIINEVRARGVGIHSGKYVNITLKPAEVNHGIIFKRLDVGGKLVRAQNAFVNEVILSTSVEENGVSISTIEHLLSAIAAMGIDNMLIEIDSFEVPIMDGSSAPFIFLLNSAGITKQDADKTFLVIKREVKVKSGDSWAKLSPFNGLKVSVEIDFEHQTIKNSEQSLTIDFAGESYVKEISRARTFGKIADLEKLQTQNKALGASMDNAIALSDDDVLNEEGVRYHNEFVKHKILDAIGDMYLLGYGLVGYYEGFKPSHMLNNKLLSAVLDDAGNYDLTTFDELPISFYDNV